MILANKAHVSFQHISGSKGKPITGGKLSVDRLYNRNIELIYQAFTLPLCGNDVGTTDDLRAGRVSTSTQSRTPAWPWSIPFDIEVRNIFAQCGSLKSVRRIEWASRNTGFLRGRPIARGTHSRL
jgi:hypothetical protein